MGDSCINASFALPSWNPPCISGLFWMFSGGGTCLPPGAQGEPCYYNETQSCQAGLVCLGFALSTCQPPSGLGERCAPAFDNACSEGYCGCTLQDQSCTWACEARRANGEECDEPRVCASGYCDSSVSPGLCADEPVGGGTDLCLP